MRALRLSAGFASPGLLLPTEVQTMFERLKKKWKVNAGQLALVLCTFALGGSLTGYAGRKLMSFVPLEKNWLWILIYIIIIYK